MKNIQIIDSAENCVFDIFEATDEEFFIIFTNNTNVAFFEDLWQKEETKELEEVFSKIWTRPVIKSKANGIHGIIFYDMKEKKQYYPTLKDEEAVNPDGTAIRGWKP